MLCPYRWPYGLEKKSSGDTHKECKHYLEVIHNTYHGGHIETDRHVIFLMPENVEKLISLIFPPQYQGLLGKFSTMTLQPEINFPSTV